MTTSRPSNTRRSWSRAPSTTARSGTGNPTSMSPLLGTCPLKRLGGRILLAAVSGLFLATPRTIAAFQASFPRQALQKANQLYDAGHLVEAQQAFRKLRSRSWDEADRTWIDF